jgi:hypothetical protein
MGEAYRLGGWGMYPTTIFGILLLGAAGWYATRPERRQLALAVCLGLTTWLTGCLGFVTGLIRTLESATNGRFPDPPINVTMVGLSECLNNIALALTALVLAMIGLSIGALRLRAAHAARDVAPAQAQTDSP